MESWVIAVLMMAAMLTGAILPLLFQLRATLRSVQRILDDGGPKLMRTLDEVQMAARQVNAIAGMVSAGSPRVNAFFEAVASLTATMNRLRDTLKVATALGAAIGPAVSAAVNAFRHTRDDGTHNNRTESEESSGSGERHGGDPAGRGEL